MNSENDQNGNQVHDSTGEQSNELGGEMTNPAVSPIVDPIVDPAVDPAAGPASGPAAGPTAPPEGPNSFDAAASFGSVLPPNTGQPVGPTEPTDGTQTGIRHRLSGRRAALAGVGAGLLVGAAIGVAGYAIADDDHREPMFSEHQMGRGGGQVDPGDGWSAQPGGRPRKGGPTDQHDGRNAPRSGGANTGARTQSGGS